MNGKLKLLAFIFFGWCCFWYGASFGMKESFYFFSSELEYEVKYIGYLLDKDEIDIRRSVENYYTDRVKYKEVLDSQSELSLIDFLASPVTQPVGFYMLIKMRN